MTRILDRYILKNFLFSFVLFLAIILALLTVVQMVTALDDVAEKAQQGFASSRILTTMLHLAAYRLPIIFYHFAPYITLMAAMFTVAKLEKSNELLAMRAAGISSFRIFLPILVFAGAVTLLAAADQELVIPKLAMRLRNIEQFISTDGGVMVAHPHRRDGFGNTWLARWYRIDNRTLAQVSIDTRRVGPRRYKLIADVAEWVDHGPGRRGWMLSRVRWFTYDQAGRIIPNDQPGQPENYRPMDSYFLRYRDDAAATAQGPDVVLTDLAPEAFTRTTRNNLEAEFLTFGELNHRIDNQMGDLKTLTMHKHRRFAHPLSNLVLLLVGLPLVVNRGKKHLAFGILLAVIVTILFEATTEISKAMVHEQAMQPELCAWLPVVVFAPVAIWLFDSMET